MANYRNGFGVGSIASLLALTLAVILAGAVSAGSLDTALAPILQSDIRGEAYRQRDGYRHPAQTLAFFELAPGQTVVEIWPGPGGWYTEILAPLLRDQGKLYAAHWSVDSQVGFFRRGRQTFDEKLAQHPQVYDRVEISVLEPPSRLEIAPDASVDRVLTFRNVHNWLKADTAGAVFSAMYKALKPGGILGVVEHRARPGTSEADMISSGYVTEARVIELARAAGFDFIAASDINANPLDDTRHPEGVWSLPPSLRGGDVDREGFLAIGESDRMTLKFAKPR